MDVLEQEPALDIGASLINVLLGYMPSGKTPRPEHCAVEFVEKGPEGGFELIACKPTLGFDGLVSNWCVIGTHTKDDRPYQTHDTNGAVSATGVKSLVHTPQIALIVEMTTQTGWDGVQNGERRDLITVVCPKKVLEVMAKQAISRAGKLPLEALSALRPAHFEVAHVVKTRVADAAQRAVNKQRIAALEKARRVTGNEHTARRIAHLYM